MTSAVRDQEPIARISTDLSYSYAFGVRPFESDPDPRFVFPHTGLQRAYAELLTFGLSERPGLMLITAAAGTGKSILLRSLRDEQRLGENCHLLSCAGSPSFEALVKAWCAALRIAPTARAHNARYAALTAHLAARHSQFGCPALLLDDAEALEDGALKKLSDLAGTGTKDRRPVRIILAARPELDTRLARPDMARLGRTVAFRTQLQAMNEAEVGAYIGHRLAVAGCEASEALFEASAIEIIARASLGVPRVVNVLCRTAMAIAEAGGRATVSAAQVEATIQACLLHAQDQLAEEDVLSLPNIPAEGAKAVPAKLASGPLPPSPRAHWPMVVKLEMAEDAARGGAAARPWTRKFLRAAPGLLVGVVFGLAVVTFYPARVQTPEAVAPGLLLSAEDEKLQFLEADSAVPASAPSVETGVPQAEPAGLNLEPWLETPAIEPAPVVLAPGASVEAPGPMAAPAALERETWLGTPAIEAEAASPVPEPLPQAPAIEAESVVPPQDAGAETQVQGSRSSGPAEVPPNRNRASETAPAPPARAPQVKTRTPEARPVVPAPKPRAKPQLFRGQDKSAAVSVPEAADAGADPEPSSWLGKLTDLLGPAQPPRESWHSERQPDR